MVFDQNAYYSYILKGDLHGAIHYIQQFPEQSDLYNRFIAVFENERYITYDVDAELNQVLTIYQQYYRDVFYLLLGKETAAENLRTRLAAFLGIPDTDHALEDLELLLTNVFQSKGFYFLAGRTSGYYGPYIWQTTETVSYNVELPDGIQTYSVKLLDGFLTRSWINYLSFGEISPGGWTDADGIISCVKSSYDFDSENFHVSLLKHEAQHARDLAADENMSSETLEYRAKLVELIYSKQRNLLKEFLQEADASDPSNGHAMAAHRIVKGFTEQHGKELGDLTIEQLQNTAQKLFAESSQ